MHELTGYDRATISKFLQQIPYHPGPKASKLYWSPLALRVIVEMASFGQISSWTETILNSIKTGDIKISPPQKESSHD